MADRDPRSNDDSSAIGGGLFIVPEEHRAAVLKGLREVERGEFASDEEMAALWKECGLQM